MCLVHPMHILPPPDTYMCSSRKDGDVPDVRACLPGRDAEHRMQETERMVR
jgi:hypothetical protein